MKISNTEKTAKEVEGDVQAEKPTKKKPARFQIGLGRP